MRFWEKYLLENGFITEEEKFVFCDKFCILIRKKVFTGACPSGFW